jgi:hypothetical protein
MNYEDNEYIDEVAFALVVKYYYETELFDKTLSEIDDEYGFSVLYNSAMLKYSNQYATQIKSKIKSMIGLEMFSYYKKVVNRYAFKYLKEMHDIFESRGLYDNLKLK